MRFIRPLFCPFATTQAGLKTALIMKDWEGKWNIKVFTRILVFCMCVSNANSAEKERLIYICIFFNLRKLNLRDEIICLREDCQKVIKWHLLPKLQNYKV